MLFRLPKISAALIVRDEAEGLEACLQSLEGFDELVVVDTGSVDETKSIAQRFTDKIFDYRWEDDFSVARECARSYCTNEWIFAIDGDEVLAPGGYHECLQSAGCGSGHDVFDALIQDSDGLFEYWSSRLYANKPEVKWVGSVHSVLHPIGIPSNITITHNRSIKKDPDRSYQMLKNVLAEQPDLIRERYFLGREEAARHNYISALYNLEECFAKTEDIPIAIDAALLIAKVYRALNKPDAAKAWAIRALSMNIDFREAAEFLSFLHYETKSKPESELFEKIANRATNRGVRYISKRSWLDAKI